MSAPALDLAPWTLRGLDREGVADGPGGAASEARTPRPGRLPIAVTASGRHAGLDALRGLAILLMISDHAAMLAGDWGVVWRVTVGRIAFPLFFLIAGHLAHRFGIRHVAVMGLGLFLPLVAPWVDNPNVLVLYGLGTLALVACARYRVPLLLVLVACLTLAANRWDLTLTGYEGAAVLALMVVGAMLPRQAFDWSRDTFPAWLVSMGRRPLRWYVGHVLVVTWLGVVLGVL